LPPAKLDIDVNAVILNDNEINAKTPVFVRQLLTAGVLDAALEQYCVTCGSVQCVCRKILLTLSPLKTPDTLIASSVYRTAPV